MYDLARAVSMPPRASAQKKAHFVGHTSARSAERFGPISEINTPRKPFAPTSHRTH